MINNRPIRTTHRGSLIIRERQSICALRELIKQEESLNLSFDKIRSRLCSIRQYKIDLNKSQQYSSRKSLKINSILRQMSSINDSSIKENKLSININDFSSPSSTRGINSIQPSRQSGKSSDRFSLHSRFSSNKKLSFQSDDCISNLKNTSLKDLSKLLQKLSRKLITLKQKNLSTSTVQRIIQIIRYVQSNQRELEIRITQIQKYIKNLQQICGLQKVIKCNYLKECVKQFNRDKQYISQKCQRYCNYLFIKQILTLYEQQINQLNVLITLFGNNQQFGDIKIIKKKINDKKLTPFELSQLKKYCQSNILKV